MTTAATEEENNESSGEGVDDQPNIPMETQQSSGRSDRMSERARKKESKEESAESASTGSSEGKSGSGGGYSADCSASDQSSDENGDRKDTSSNLSLNVGGLTLHDRAASRSSNSSGEAPSEQNEGGREAEANDNASASVSKNDGKSIEQNDANSLGIELPMKSPDTIDLESIMRSKTKEERESAAAMQDYQVLPQWNGVRVAHPMDPRIDLSSVTVLQAGVVPGVFQSIEKQQQLQSGQQSEEASAPFSVDNYAQLLEVVRPFFQSHGVTWHQNHNPVDNHNRNEVASDQVDSSEGFTSFFTTTNSGGNSGGTTNSGSPQSSDLDKKPRAANYCKTEIESDNADASSMVVLARVKRKHKRDENSGDSASSGDKRVRIQDRIDNQHGQHPARAAYEADANGGSSGSSSLTNVPNQEPLPQQQQPQAAPLHIPVPPRIVTDASSSKTSSATSSNVNTSSASGSGSGGNTGSGSNQGSSGSGNEGKGSREEPAQGDNSGESPVDGSDHSFKKPAPLVAHAPETREKKLLDKKRKRIEMRREYEAQQEMESSESSDPNVSVVRPGKPVTMDQVLRFSTIARIVIQATPPFLIVHTNAAFARLTGIDSHQAVGQQISLMVSLPEKALSQQQHPSEDGSNPQASDTSSAVPAQTRSKNFELERLIATSGHGRLQVLKVVCRHHQMVGRSVTITKEVHESGKQDALAGSVGEAAKPDRRVESSLAGGLQLKTCKASIAPIVSVSAYMPKSSMTTDNEPLKQKRRKSHSQETEDAPSQAKDHKQRPTSPNKDHKKNPSRLIVSHYIIQLEDASSKSGNHFSMESLSSNSTSVEARLVGLTKEEYRKQKFAASVAAEEDDQQGSQPPADDEGGSESTPVPEHVSTLG